MNKKVNEHLKQLISEAIQKSIDNQLFDSKGIPAIILTTPKNPEHGHLSTNVALQLAGILQKKPRQIAHLIVQEIEKKKDGLINKIEVAGPGFILSLIPI